jgi:hypothetical protein
MWVRPRVGRERRLLASRYQFLSFVANGNFGQFSKISIGRARIAGRKALNRLAATFSTTSYSTSESAG